MATSAVDHNKQISRFISLHKRNVSAFADRQRRLGKGIQISRNVTKQDISLPIGAAALEGRIETCNPILHTPGPQTYCYMGRPLNETNAPAFSFGRRCAAEKELGGSRRSWQKEWFNSEDVWTQKVDFQSDCQWPSPANFNFHTVGHSVPTLSSSPRFSFGREKTSSSRQDQNPAPTSYDVLPCYVHTRPSAHSYSHGFRVNGTILASPIEPTPGPAAYLPTLSGARPRGPQHTFYRSYRRPFRYEAGPFSAC